VLPLAKTEKLKAVEAGMDKYMQIKDSPEKLEVPPLIPSAEAVCGARKGRYIAKSGSSAEAFFSSAQCGGSTGRPYIRSEEI
jgi:hypothetical protein